MMITIKNDLTVDPLGLKWLRDSRFQLLAPTRDIRESLSEMDGDIDFGTELSAGDINLVCVTEEGLSKSEKVAKKDEIARVLNDLRNGDWLKWESDPDKKIFVRLAGMVEIEEFRTWIRVIIPLKVDPFWVSTEENEHIGSGTIENRGTFETPVIVEVSGSPSATSPAISVGGEVLLYKGVVSSVDSLVIDTDKQTVTFNGQNALKLYEGSFPMLQPGETEVLVPDGSNVIFKWRSRWL